MKLGCCAAIEDAQKVKDAGFDFIECTVASLMPEKDEDYDKILKTYKESPIPIKACNIFLPRTWKITGEAVDEVKIKRYLQKAMLRVKEIGAEFIVFGSGGVRAVPEGFSQQKAEEQLVNFLHLAADQAEPLELAILVEPLNRKESNVINSVPEAVEFAKKVNRPSIQVIADFYHMEEENEPLENIAEAKAYIQYVHVADSDRLPPGAGNYPYTRFMEVLRKADYDGPVSIEAKWNDFEKELTEAKKFMDKYINESKP